MRGCDFRMEGKAFRVVWVGKIGSGLHTWSWVLCITFRDTIQKQILPEIESAIKSLYSILLSQVAVLKKLLLARCKILIPMLP